VAATSPGDLIIACEWPNIGLQLTTAKVSAELILDAAQRSKELWPAEDLPEWPGSTGDPNDT